MKNEINLDGIRLKTLGGDRWTENDMETGLPFTRQEIKAFELWYQFMRLTDRRDWSDEVQHDFTPIKRREDDGTLADISFEKWWHENSRAFWKLRLLAVEEIDDDNRVRFDEMAMEMKEYDGTPIVFFALFPDATVTDLKRRFAEILAKYPASRKSAFYNYDSCYGRNTGNGAGWEKYHYGLYAEPDARYGPNLRMLQNILDIYVEWQALRKTRKKFSYAQIEQRVSDRRVKQGKSPIINRKKIRVDNAGNTYHWNGLTIDGKTAPPPPNEKELQAATVSRALIQARFLLENVANGVFPKLTPPSYRKDLDKQKLTRRNGKKKLQKA